METPTQELPTINYDNPFDVWFGTNVNGGPPNLELEYKDGETITVTDFQQGVEVLNRKNCNQCLFEWLSQWGELESL